MIHYTYQNSKHENFNSHKSQTMDFRLAYCFSLRQLPTGAKVMSTVNTETLLSVLPLFLQELNLEMAKNKSRIILIITISTMMFFGVHSYRHPYVPTLLIKVKVKYSMAKSLPMENLLPQNVGSIINYLQ